jgi:ABC-type multidrug transport system ATPase subunit
MSLLELEDVSRRGRGGEGRLVLREVCLEVEPGELIGIWGRRHSGRSTLLRIAAGLERPDEGVVRFDGAEPATDDRRGGVRFCRRRLRPVDGASVVEQLITSQLACGVPAGAARERANAALERVGASRCATHRSLDLGTGELVQVAIARALTHGPQVLVIDEPTLGVELDERDTLLELLRSLAKQGVAVLMSAGDSASLTGADRVLSLSAGRLRGETAPAEPAPVIELHARRSAAR